MTPLRVFIGCALLALAAGEAAAAAADDVKHITVFNNGAASGGVELRVTRAEARDWPALLARIQHALPVGDAQCSSATAPLTRTLELQLEKRHAAPGATAVAALYSARGERVAAFDALRAGERHYAVPDDLLFVWPFVHVGHNVTLADGQIGAPAAGVAGDVVLEAVSDRPRIFKVHNFLSDDEADQLIANIEAITDPVYKLKRSTTGVHTDSRAQLVTTRTSENAFDTNTPTARAIKRRMFDLLRMPEYDERLADGLQLLRYRQREAYIPHHDWFGGSADRSFNFDPATGGSNRFATVFLYLSDVEHGGQTVFPHAERPPVESNIEGIERSPMPDIAKELFNDTDWELDVVRKCYEKLAFRPRKATALLFYSQTGQGVLDDLSLHGACPVLEGTKWGANLWVWNKVRHGLEPSKKSTATSTSTEITAVFVNRTPGEVSLLWQDQEMQKIAAGQRASFNTYHSHQWSALYNGEKVWSHTINVDDGTDQQFYIDRPQDLPDADDVDTADYAQEL